MVWSVLELCGSALAAADVLEGARRRWRRAAVTTGVASRPVCWRRCYLDCGVRSTTREHVVELSAERGSRSFEAGSPGNHHGSHVIIEEDRTE